MQLYWVSLNGYLLSGNTHWMGKYYWLKNLELRNKCIDVNENVLIQQKVTGFYKYIFGKKTYFYTKIEFYYLNTVIDLRSNWQYIWFSKLVLISVSIACISLKLYCVKKSNKHKSNSSVSSLKSIVTTPCCRTLSVCTKLWGFILSCLYLHFWDINFNSGWAAPC